jgi:hypothetical protein
VKKMEALYGRHLAKLPAPVPRVVQMKSP